MPARNLNKMFEPKNIAMIGASGKEGSVEYSLMENLTSRTVGDVFPVNLNKEHILGQKVFPNISKIPKSVDLGVIATPAETVPGIVRECGEAGIPALIIISAGFSEVGAEGEKLEEKIEKIRKKYGMRILGPNCLGLINPYTNLNATFIKQIPEQGNVAFMSQSGSVATSTLDWATSAQFGFSSFISVGNMLDVDFSDLIDYFGRHPKTRSILMYIENIKDARGFISAARSFARTKPIMAVKPGKYGKKDKTFTSFTASLAGSDKVYAGAFKRAGVTRVDTIDDLFTCSEVLTKQRPPHGYRLAIVTTAKGPGVMASDAIIDQGGEVASLSKDTLKILKKSLPPNANINNPINVSGNATQEEYRKAVKACLKDQNVDGVLSIYAPPGSLSSTEAAKAIADLKGSLGKPILACWMGQERFQKGRELLRENGFSVQSTPEQSVKAYMYLNSYARNLERLLETPEELPVDRTPPRYHLLAMFRRVDREEREALTEVESKKVLETYGISTPSFHVAETSEEAVEFAARLGFPIDLKIHSPDIIKKHKTGAVKSNITSKSEVKKEFRELIKQVREKRPKAVINGVIVQKTVKNSNIDLILGSKKDSTWGTTLMFGKGGRNVEYFEDVAVGLPPLNQALARHLMNDTKVYHYLTKFQNAPKILQSLEEYLVKLSQLIIDFPQIKELDINPLSVTDDEVLAVDALIKIDKNITTGKPSPHQHLVVEPYPRKYVEQWQLDDGTPVTLRPIRPEDEPLEFDLFDTFSEETWRYRFFGPMREVTHEDMVRYTNIDYRREMAIVAILTEDDERKMIGVGRLIKEPEKNEGEFAVVLGDPWQGLGLGEKLTDALIGIAEDMGLDAIWGTILEDNAPMIGLCKKLGFEIKSTRGDTVKAVLSL